MKFEQLISSIENIQEELLKRTAVQVNTNLSIRNWLFGLYIVEFEQNGEDRANYGERLFEELSLRLKNSIVKGASATNLKICRQFYNAYPQMGKIADQLLHNGNIVIAKPIRQSVTDELKNCAAREFEINSLAVEVLVKSLSFRTFLLIPQKSMQKKQGLRHCHQRRKTPGPCKEGWGAAPF